MPLASGRGEQQSQQKLFHTMKLGAIPFVIDRDGTIVIKDDDALPPAPELANNPVLTTAASPSSNITSAPLTRRRRIVDEEFDCDPHLLPATREVRTLISR
jgi:hypothetical protein